MPPIYGFLLDMDGVLVDSATVHHRAWRALFEPFGVDFTAARFKSEALGVSRETVITTVLGERDDLTDLMRQKAHLVEQILEREGCSVIPGAAAFLTEIHRRGIPASLATSSRMPGPFLRAAGLADLVANRVDRTHVQRGKPAPDLFFAAAKVLGMAPTQCVVVEDSPAGVAAAITAGCPVVGLTTNQEPDALGGCDLVVDQLVDIWPWFEQLNSAEPTE